MSLPNLLHVSALKGHPQENTNHKRIILVYARLINSTLPH